MSPLDAKLILDEIAKLNRRFDESYARMERCFSRTLAALEPRGDAVELRVGSPEQFGATQPVVADNWGGLFVENPAFFPATDTTFTVPDAPACITPAPPVSAAAFDPTKENEPEESLPAEYQHRIQELEEKLQDDDIAAPEEALSKRPPDAAFDSKLSGTVGKATSTDKPRLSLMYPLPQTDLDRLYELGRRKLKQVVSPIEPVPVELALHILDDTRVVTLQRATGTHSPRLMERIADLNASYGGGEVEFVGVDMQRIYNGFMPDDPGLLGCVRLTFRPSFIERVLRASAPGGYDGSLDDDPEFGIPHVVALLDRAIGRDGQAPAAAAALRSDAVGAAGGGLLAWEMAVGSAQSTCSTIFLAGDSSFAEVFLVRVTELSITAVSAPLAYTVAPHREAAATYIMLVPVAAIVVFANGGEPGFHLSIIHDASAISAYAFARIMKDVLAHHGEASSPLLLRGHGPVHAYDAASVLYDRAATTPHNWFALQASQHAVEFVTDSIVLAMLLFVDISKEHASPGALQAFEVLLLHADIFCNICIDRELLSHLSLGVTQHQPWPPPDELRLTSCDAELRPTPWPSFNIAKRLSVRSSCGRLWKPPWPIHIRQHVRCPCDLLIQLKPWPARHGQQDGLSCATTTVLLLLELLKLKKNCQCALCLEPTHLGVTRDCFPDEYSIANLCSCVVLTGCVHMASDINVSVLLLAGELIQEQKQKDHNGCSSNTNIIFTNPQDSVQFCISFTLTNSCSMSWVVCWKPPWLIPLRQQIRYRAVTSAYYRGALGALLLYDIPRRQSFHPIPCWLDAQAQAVKNIVIMLVGNTGHLKEPSTVSIGDAQFAVQEHLFFLKKAISVQEPSKIWKWSTESPDILAVVLAEGGMDEALDALDEVERITTGAKPQGTLSTTDIQALKRAISESHQKLANQLAEAASQSSIIYSGVKFRDVVSALKRLDDGPQLPLAGLHSAKRCPLAIRSMQDQAADGAVLLQEGSRSCCRRCHAVGLEWLP